MLRRCLVPLIFVLAAALALLSGASAQETFDCRAVAEGGAWDVPATWVDCNNATPGVNDSAIVSGKNVHVTIKSGLFVQVASVSVEEAAQLTNAGTLRAAELQVYGQALLSSTGPLDLSPHRAGSVGVGLLCQQASIQLSRDLTIIGSTATMEVELCEIEIKGSLNITSDSDYAHLSVTTFSHLSVSGDVIILGSYSPDSTFLYWDSVLEVGGDLRLATRPDLNPSGTAQPSTGSVVAMFLGGQLSVGGDLAIESGEALETATGPAGLWSGLIPLGFIDPSDAFQLPDFHVGEELMLLGTSGSITVGGSVVVRSGSITGLHDGELTSGLAVINLGGGQLTAPSVSVVSGHGHNGTSIGGSAGEAVLALGLKARLIVAKDVLVKSGDGGNGASDTANGGDSGLAVFGLIAGGEALIGGSLHILAGSGGNASLAEYATGGAGGSAIFTISAAGRVSVAGDQLISSGSGGIGATGGSGSGASAVMSGSGYIGFTKRAQQATRQAGSLPSTGGMSLHVGGDLSILSGNAASSIAEGASGGSCGSTDSAEGMGGGGLIVMGSWEAEVVIGGDLRVVGCNGGNSVGAGGGTPAMTAGIAVMSDVTLNVYGSVEVVGGNGGSVVGGSQDAAPGALSFVICFDSALLDIAGSLTVTRGNSGDVVNGTGSVQSGEDGGSLFSGVIIGGSSHLVVGGGKGAITVTGGHGGNIYAADTEGSSSYGGMGGVVPLAAMYQSTITAGHVRVIGSDTGNAFTNSELATKRAASGGAQKRAPAWSDLFLHEEDFQRWQKERAPGDLSLNFAGLLDSGATLFSLADSTITINGKLEIEAGATGATNLLPPQPGQDASLVVAARSSIVLNGDARIIAAAGGRTDSSDVALGGGGSATIQILWDSTLTARGDIVLQAGDASQGPNATETGIRGSASVALADLSRFDQSGLVSLKDGVGLVNETVVPITVSRSEWNVFPCPDAGLEMSGEHNSSAFVVEAFGTFRDCRGSAAKQHYPEPSVVGFGDASCSPCTCSEASFSSCPADSSSATGLHLNSPVMWLLARF